MYSSLNKEDKLKLDRWLIYNNVYLNQCHKEKMPINKILEYKEWLKITY